MPGSAPGVRLKEDVLARCASGADAIDGCLVQVGHELVVHVMILVVRVEDDEVIGRKAAGHGRPPGFEAGGIGDDVAVIASWGVLVAALCSDFLHSPKL